MVYSESSVSGYTAVKAVSWTGQWFRFHNACIFKKYLPDDGPFRLEACSRYCVKLNYSKCAAIGWFYNGINTMKFAEFIKAGKQKIS